MLILYGTETGCARDVAERVGREAARRLVAPRVVAMDDYDVGDLPDEAMVVCVCATTGDGDVPSTMASFWRFLLRRDLPRANAGGANAGGANAGAAAGDDGGGGGALAGVKFAVFGLGDSAYAQFNVVARKLHARLVQLGAAAMHPLTLGDDQSPFGLAGDVDVCCAFSRSLTILWLMTLQSCLPCTIASLWKTRAPPQPQRQGRTS